MMLIDIEPILDAAKLAGKEYVSIDFLKGFEQVDAVPVVHGEWITTETYSYAYRINLRETTCSACGKRPNIYMLKSDYCPNCGAKLEDKP